MLVTHGHDGRPATHLHDVRGDRPPARPRPGPTQEAALSSDMAPTANPSQPSSAHRLRGQLADIRVALPLAFRQWGATTLWTVMVLPVLVDQVAAALHPGAAEQERYYAWGWVAGAGLIALLTLGPAARSQLRQLRDTRRITQIDVSHDDELQDVRCLVSLRGIQKTTPKDPSKTDGRPPEEQVETGTVRTLLPLMKGLRKLVLVGSSASSLDVWRGDWADSDLRRRITVDRHMIEVEAFKEPAHNQDVLVSSLRKLVDKYGTHRVAVDLTQGTSMMTLAAHEAAGQLGVRTIYVGNKAKDPDAPLVVWSPTAPLDGRGHTS